MNKLSELPAYDSKFLKAADLGGINVKATISSVDIRETKKYMSEEKEKRAFLRFEGKSKELQLTKTNVGILEGAFGDTDSMIGKEVILSSAKTLGGKDTVAITIPEAVIQTEDGDIDMNDAF